MSSKSCYNCLDRHIGCHNACDIYKKYKEKMSIIHKNKRRERLLRGNYTAYEIE